MRRTPTYRLEYFETGDFYENAPEARRFITVDYNLQSYVGIVGDGVAHGWEVESLGGRLVQVTPGGGFIGGFYAETPWHDQPTPKRRSEAQADGDILIREIPGWSAPDSTSMEGAFYPIGNSLLEQALVFSHFGPEGESTLHDGVVDSVSQPHFVAPPEEFFDDPYVQAVDPNDVTLLLDDDDDLYVFARRANPGSLDINDRFAAFGFGATVPAHAVPLALVSVRNGTVAKIDAGVAPRLNGFQGTISAKVRDALQKHRHGGGRPGDPPRINLKTDSRRAYLWRTLGDRRTQFRVLSPFETGATDGHRHTYTLDTAGNGYTQELIGGGSFHYHRIQSGVTGAVVQNFQGDVPDHTHSLGATAETWTASSALQVYVNETPIQSGYSLDVARKLIVFDPGVAGARNAIFSSTFQVSDNPDIPAYSFEMETDSVRTFLLRLISDFQQRFKTELENRQVRDPFTFYRVGGAQGKNAELSAQGFTISPPTPIHRTPAGPPSPEPDFIEGFLPLDEQADMIAANLQQEGDRFVLLPPAARFIPVTLVRAARTDAVRLEVLEDIEVAGVLPAGHITFVDAARFVTGQFTTARLPFLSHVGRIREEMRPVPDRAVTGDGVAYYAVASRTTTQLGHSHKVVLDRQGDGATAATLVEGQIATFVSSGDETLRLAHTHLTEDHVLSETVSAGVNQWQGAETGAKHTHALFQPAGGDAKTVFAMAEDPQGNLYLGTSDGLRVAPASIAYRVRLGLVSYDVVGQTGLEAVKTALRRHFLQVGESYSVPDDTVAQNTLGLLAAEPTVGLAVTLLGYSELFQGARETGLPRGKTASVEVLTLAEVDNFFVEEVRPETDLSPDDVRLQMFTVPADAVITPDLSLAALLDLARQNATQTRVVYRVRRDFQHETVWQAWTDADESGALYVVTPRRVLRQHPGTKQWSELPLPSSVRLLSALAQDCDDNLWLATDDGVFLQHRASGAGGFRATAPVGEQRAVSDVLEGSPGALLAAAADGVYRSEDEGATWTRKLEADQPVEILRDYWLDRTDEATAGGETHYHQLLSDQYGNGFTTGALRPDGTPLLGPDHLHALLRCVAQETAQPVAHSHAIVTTLVVRTRSHRIYRSTDSGETWAETGSIPSSYGERGKLLAAFGNLYAAAEQGLLVSEDHGATWNLSALRQRFHSFAWSHDRSRIFLGGDNTVQATGGDAFAAIHSLGGQPVPSLFVDGVRQFFTFAYNNRSRGFFFRRPPRLEALVEPALSYTLWRAPTGGWSPGSDYLVRVDGKKVFSVRPPLDRRQELGLNFTVRPSEGVVEFAPDSAAQLDHASRLQVTVLESALRGIGRRSHEELEDAFAVENSGLPMSLSEAYGRNLAETVLSLQHALPAVDAGLKRWRAYRMRFARDPSQSDYIGRFFDVENSNLRSSAMLATPLDPVRAGAVHVLADGIHGFAGLLFAGTDAGLFVTVVDPGGKGNWFFLSRCPAGAVYDLTFPSREDILVAGQNGAFRSHDFFLEQWETADSRTSGLSALVARPRWRNFGVPGREWWNRWNGLDNLTDPDLHNTFLVGGRNFLSTSFDEGRSWQEASLHLGSNQTYVVRQVLPVKDGSALLALNNVKSPQTTLASSRLLATAGHGTDWPTPVLIWEGAEGVIRSVSLTEFNHTALEVGPDGLPAVAVNSWIGLTLFARERPWTIVSHAGHRLVVQGNEAADVLRSGDTYLVQPPTVNALAETRQKQVFLASNLGLFADRGSYATLGRAAGSVRQVNKQAGVRSLDIQGTIQQVTVGIVPAAGNAPARTQTQLSCRLDRLVSAESLSGQDLLILNQGAPTVSILNPAQAAVLLSSSVTARFSVEGVDLGNSGFLAVQVDSLPPAYRSVDVFALENLAPGAHTLRAFLTDASRVPLTNTEASASISFTVTFQSTAPSLAILFPRSNETVSPDAGGQIALFFQVSNFSISLSGRIGYGIAGHTTRKILGAGVTQDLISGLANGSHTLQAFLVDNNFNDIGVSASVTFAVTGATGAEAGSTGTAPSQGPSAPAETSSPAVLARYRIASNGSSASNGDTLLTVAADTGRSVLFRRCVVAGSQSRIHVAFDQPVAADEFAGGILYVDPLAPANPGRSYAVVRNDTDSVTVSTQVTPGDLQANDTVYLIPASGSTTLLADTLTQWRDNELAGKPIRLVSPDTAGSSATPEVFVVRSNRSKEIVLAPGADPLAFVPGDTFSLESAVFVPSSAFNKTRTSVDLDHTHDVSLVGGFVRGKIASLTALSESFIRITVGDTVGFQNSLIQSDPLLLKGAPIRFYNAGLLKALYQQEVDSTGPDFILVKVTRREEWNLTGSQPLRISPGFTWEIDAFDYGRAGAVSYQDFIVFQSRLASDGEVGAGSVTVEDASGFDDGDRVEIWDAEPHSQFLVVQGAPAGSVVSLSTVLEQTFRLRRGAHLRKRAGSFGSSHTHRIRHGEVSTETVSDFVASGYPLQHSHYLSNRLQTVHSVLFEHDLNRLVAAGSGSSLYHSDDQGRTWSEMVDLGGFLPSQSHVRSLSQNNAGDLLAGTGDGFVLAQVTGAAGATALAYPLAEDYRPSSSSASSSSSSSSPSEESSSTSSASRSSSSSTSSTAMSESSSSTSTFASLSSSSSTVLGESSSSS